MLRQAWWKALCCQWAETRGYSLNRCLWAETRSYSLNRCHRAETRDYSLNRCQNLDSEVTNATSTKAVSTLEFNLPTTHHSSWKPEVLPPATLTSRTSALHQAYFLKWLVSELNSIMCLSGLGPRPWPQLQKELEKRNFLISTLAGGHEKSVQRGLTTWRSDRYNVICFNACGGLCVFILWSLIYTISPKETEVHSSSLSKQILIKIQECPEIPPMAV